jgi:NAD(P)-dependent dehydrogenase (short-subunit alcohol dehydrogenase family)
MSRASWDLQRRTAFVTGGAPGIGLETARRLAAAGMSAALMDRDGDGAAAAARARELGDADRRGDAAV